MFSLSGVRRFRGGMVVLVGIFCALLAGSAAVSIRAADPRQPAEPLLSDQSFVFHPDLFGFDVETFLRRQNSGLLTYEETADSDTWSAVETIENTAHIYSISPYVLLTLLEMHTGAVTSPTLSRDAVDHAFGHPDAGLRAQLDAAAQALFAAYYGFVEGDPAARAAWPEGMNAGTVAIAALLGDTLPDDEARAQGLGRGSGSFHAVFQTLFGDPLAGRLVNQAPTAPMTGARLPWTPGEAWNYNSGPHNTFGTDACSGGVCARPWSSVDFGTPERVECVSNDPEKYPPDRWAVAVRGGAVIHVSGGVATIDHEDGWQTQYTHLANDDIVSVGPIKQGDKVGRPSCNYSGGRTDGVHLHFALKYNGQYYEIDGTNLGGWTIGDVGAHYTGTMTCPDGRAKSSNTARVETSKITDDCVKPASAVLSVVLVIDSSGSMSSNDPRRLRIDAVKAFIDAAQPGDEIGLVEFDSSSYTRAAMTIINSDADKIALKAAADRIGAGGSTSINAGLNTGFGLLSAAAGNAQERAAILLTDGDHNVGAYNNRSHLQYADKGWPIYTVGLGQSNQTLMARIAAETGGECVNNCRALTDPAQLGVLYQSMRANLTSSNPITQQQTHITQGQTQHFPTNVNPNQFTTQFYIGWQGSEMDLSLTTPGGAVIDAANMPPNVRHAKGATYELFQVDFPQPGLWKMSIYGKDVPPGGEQVDIFSSTQGMSYLYQPLSFDVPAEITTTPLLNGNFEQGRNVGWQEHSSNGFALIYDGFDPSVITPHSGAWMAWLGGVYNETSTLSQSATVPAATPVLSFYHLIDSADSCGHDFMRVRVGGQLFVEQSLCDATDTNGWARRTIDLSALAGQTVLIEFIVTTNDALNSNLFIDDVAFAAAARQADDDPPAAERPAAAALSAAMKER